MWDEHFQRVSESEQNWTHTPIRDLKLRFSRWPPEASGPWTILELRSMCSVAKSCLTLSDPMDCSTSGFPVLHHLLDLLKLMSIESEMPSKHLTLCRPLLFPPSIFPSTRVFSNESALCLRWPKNWSFSSILPLNIQGWFPLGLTVLISLLS